MFTGMQRPKVSIRFLSQSLNWRLLILARPTSQQALGILLSLPFQYYKYGYTLMCLAFLRVLGVKQVAFLHDSILPTEPPSRLHTFHLETESQKIAQAGS